MEINCSHYQRGCDLYASCCDSFWPCRLCHDQFYEHTTHQHTLNRFEVSSVRCRDCHHVQKPQQNCEACGKLFGHYFCDICNLFDNDTTKEITHCDKCGFCVMGRKEQLRHCDTCKMCYKDKEGPRHRCIENLKEESCSVCCERLFTVGAQLNQLRCGHWLHKDCRIELNKHRMYNCPI